MAKVLLKSRPEDLGWTASRIIAQTSRFSTRVSPINMSPVPAASLELDNTNKVSLIDEAPAAKENDPRPALSVLDLEEV
jgi:hypothetical protein